LKIAIVGAGVSGLSCSYWLGREHDVTVFESAPWLGGHVNTVEVEVDDATFNVDTGFIVYNERNYPIFSRLLADLGVASQPSDMSFSISCGSEDFEYRGNGLGLWAQPSNLLRSSYGRLLADIMRFNRNAQAMLRRESALAGMTLDDFVRCGDYCEDLRNLYLVPLGSAIWSSNPAYFSQIPARTFLQFFENHGMLSLKGRPQWRTVRGGAKRYVEELERTTPATFHRSVAVEKVSRSDDSVTVLSERGPEDFDALILALHSDEALKLLADPSRPEREILGSIRYAANVATLHTDTSMLPRRRKAWASWNAFVPSSPSGKPTLTYWMNRLQRFESSRQICVTLNRPDEIDQSTVIGEWTYDHPVFDSAAIAAQSRRPEIQGHRRTWYCGAYWGYGFHEDGISSALDVCSELGALRT